MLFSGGAEAVFFITNLLPSCHPICDRVLLNYCFSPSYRLGDQSDSLAFYIPILSGQCLYANAANPIDCSAYPLLSLLPL